ncbi:MAG: glutamate 5-kinase, partial [Dehalococcoidia bacterium]|nr:glutamate 5-kinase [Dehalococcoidia bacterium]
MAAGTAKSRSRVAALYRRLVVKLGTNLLTGGSDRLDQAIMGALADQVAALLREGQQVVVVTSGAIAAGREELKERLSARGARGRGAVPIRQMLAAVGQSRLMQSYQTLFAPHGITVAQTLLTKADLDDRAGYLNARNTLLGLLELGVVPIVNENDVVATDEIKEAKFGDNDNLSATVANLVDADLLALLTDQDGLFSADPRHDASARLIPRVEVIDEAIEALAGEAGSQHGVGGMATKIEAARLATSSGVAVVIANGRAPQVLLRLSRGEAVGTLFPPSTSKLESRQRWLLAGLSTRGTLALDEGAVRALRQQGRSLLPAGVKGVEGQFQRGDVVTMVDPQGRRAA